MFSDEDNAHRTARRLNTGEESVDEWLWEDAK